MKNKILTLTKIMFKNDESMNSFMDTSGKKKSFFNNKFMKGLFFLLLIALVAFSMITITIDTYGNLHTINAETLIPKLAFSSASLFVFIFGIFYVLNIFYFSNDIENYLYLPVKPGDIITAKFFTSLIYEYVIIGMLFLPILITYGYLSSQFILYYLVLLISFIFLPIYPITIASVLSIIIMRYSKGAKNKDRFKTIAGIFTLVFAIGFNLLIQFFANKTELDPALGVETINNLPFINILNKLFPSSYLSYNAILNSNNTKGLLYLAMLILISIIAILIFNLVGNKFYFDGVVGIQESGAKRKIISSDKLSKSLKSKNKILSYTIKEFKIIFRTPVFFLNNVLMSFIFPILILIPFITSFYKLDSAELNGILEVLREVDKSIILLSLLALMFFLGSSNGIASTSISKEGKGFYFMKYVPMKYIDQIYSKILVALTIQFIPFAIFFIIASFILNLDTSFIIISLFITILASLLQNQISIIFDIMWPKLNWDTEQKAIKQNLNYVFQMLLGFILTGFTIFILIKFNLTYFISSLSLLILLPILVVLMHFILIKISNIRFASY